MAYTITVVYIVGPKSLVGSGFLQLYSRIHRKKIVRFRIPLYGAPQSSIMKTKYEKNKLKHFADLSMSERHFI